MFAVQALISPCVSPMGRGGPAMNATLNLSSQTTTGGRRDDTKVIMLAIRDADRRMRERFPVLRHQTALGMGLVGLGYTTAVLFASLYYNTLIAPLVCIVINAMAFAVLREIEHDLIHNLYFKN